MTGKSKTHKNGSTILNWNSGGNLINSLGIKEFLRFGSTASSLAESSTKIVVPYDGILTNLIVKLDTNTNNDPSPGKDNSRIFTIRKNGQDTSLFVKISDNEIHNESNSKIFVKKYDLISLSHHVNSGVPNNAIGIASVNLTK